MKPRSCGCPMSGLFGCHGACAESKLAKALERLKAAEETIRNMRYALIDATEQNAKGLDDDWDLVREAFALANKYLGEGT